MIPAFRFDSALLCSALSPIDVTPPNASPAQIGVSDIRLTLFQPSFLHLSCPQ